MRARPADTEPSFQNAVRCLTVTRLEQGLFGWNVTDCKICFEYGLLLQSGQHAGGLPLIGPIVLEQALKESGTQLLNLISFILYAPRNNFPGLIMMHRNTVPPSKTAQ